MDIWEVDKLVLFLVFVIPGFISLKTYALLVPGPVRNSGDQLIDAVAYSCINFAILWVPMGWVEASSIPTQSPIAYYAFYLLLFVVAPVSWVAMFKWLRTRPFVTRMLPHPTGKAWDFFFEQRRILWAKITLENGTVIAGRYSTASFATSAPCEDQIYLEEAWVIGEKGGFVRPKNGTAGVLVLSKQISHIEFRNSQEKAHDATDATPQ